MTANVLAEGTYVPGLPDLAVLAWVAGVGALAGSFLNVVIYRVPARRSIVFPGSRCGFCESPVRWHDNVPVLSWVLLAGRCRSCGIGISARYPFVEALVAALAVLLVARHGLGLFPVVYGAFIAALVAVTFIDADHRIIPDEISKPGVVFGLATAFVFPHVATSSDPLLPPPPALAFAGAVLGYFSLLAIAAIGRVLAGREAMGLGDVKLLAMIGAFLGPMALPFVFLTSSLSAGIYGIGSAIVHGRRIRGSTLPFGPFLASSAMLYVLAGGEQILVWFRAAMGLSP